MLPPAGHRPDLPRRGSGGPWPVIESRGADRRVPGAPSVSAEQFLERSWDEFADPFTQTVNVPTDVTRWISVSTFSTLPSGWGTFSLTGFRYIPEDIVVPSLVVYVFA